MKNIIINQEDISQASINAAFEEYKHLSEAEKTELASNICVSMFMRELKSRMTEGETVLAKFVFNRNDGDDSVDTGWFEVIKKDNQMMFEQESTFSAMGFNFHSPNVKDIKEIVFEDNTLAPDEYFLHPLAEYCEDTKICNMWMVIVMLVNAIRGLDKNIDTAVAERKFKELLVRINSSLNANYYLAHIKTHDKRIMMEVANIIGTANP